MHLHQSASKNDLFKYLVEQIRKQKVSLFVGAGISKNTPANLPLANEFRGYVLLQLCSSEGLTGIYRKYVRNLADIPFESFVKILITSSNFLGFHLSIFGSGKPNKNHLLIAQLMAKGFVTELLTTNFDTLFEQATKVHFSKSQTLSVLLEEEQFSQTNFAKMAKPVLFKIHGGVQDPSSIRTTLDLISSQRLKEDRIGVLRHFFENPDKELVILGYSCSDYFDINPYLRSVKSKTRILFVKHALGAFGIDNLNDPLTAFSGYQISCDTDELVDYLWGEISDAEYKNEDSNEQKWTSDIQKWNMELTSAQRCYLIADLLLELRKMDASILLFKKALSRKHKKPFTAQILIRLATAQNLRGEYKKASQNYKASLSLLEEDKDYLKVAEVYHFLGMIEKLTGNYQIAEEHIMKSKDIAEKIGYKTGASIATAELGTLSQRRGDFPEAKELYEKALAMDREIGHLQGIAVNLHHLGTVARKERPLNKARELLNEELELRRKLGDKQGEAGCLHELGLCFLDVNDPNSAKRYLDETLNILREIGDKARIAWTLNDLGTVFLSLGDLQQAEALTKQSIDIKKLKNDQRGLAISLGQLALIRKRQNRKEDAKKLLKDASEIAKKSGDRDIVELTLRELSQI